MFRKSLIVISSLLLVLDSERQKNIIFFSVLRTRHLASWVSWHMHHKYHIPRFAVRIQGILHIGQRFLLLFWILTRQRTQKNMTIAQSNRLESNPCANQERIIVNVEYHDRNQPVTQESRVRGWQTPDADVILEDSSRGRSSSFGVFFENFTNSFSISKRKLSIVSSKKTCMRRSGLKTR